MINVLLADDSEVLLKAITSLLKFDPEIQIVGETSSISQTIQLVNTLQPDVIIMDIHMDEHNFTPAQIKTHLKGTVLLAISLWNDDQTNALAESYGAIALLDKANLSYELIPAIRQCMKE